MYTFIIKSELELDVLKNALELIDCINDDAEEGEVDEDRSLATKDLVERLDELA
jgi:hypothetical protein